MSGDEQIGLNLDDSSDQTENEVVEETHVYSVSELNSVIRNILEGEFPSLWLRAEISNFKSHTSGHFYFSLKDNDSQINAVMFKGLNSKLKFRPENGMEVLVRGRVTVYEPRGNYQIFCELMEPVGAGALQKAFEQLKIKLEKEGLFDPKRKRPIPSFPKHIGLVTSPTGAALQDILNVLRRRYPAARITLSPALVQGEPAPASIVKAIELINKLKDVDVLIVGRGGGSLEDLWAFNDERVARAIVASRIPIISAVGHEVDFTIADFVADLRAPTPSAAAELVAKNVQEVLEKIEMMGRRLRQGQSVFLKITRDKILSLTKRLVDPKRRLEDLQIRADELMTRLEGAFFRFIENRRVHVQLTLKKMGSPMQRIEQLSRRLQLSGQKLEMMVQQILERHGARIKNTVGKLDTLSPLRIVARGFSIVEKKQGAKKANQIITKVTEIKSGDEIEIQFAQGRALAEVKNILNQEKIKGGMDGL